MSLVWDFAFALEAAPPAFFFPALALAALAALAPFLAAAALALAALDFLAAALLALAFFLAFAPFALAFPFPFLVLTVVDAVGALLKFQYLNK